MKKFVTTNLRALATVAFALLIVTATGIGNSKAAAIAEPENTKINICHATESEKNPYEALNVSVHSSHDNHVLDFAYTGPLHDGKPDKDGDDWCLSQRTVTPKAVTFTNATCDTKGNYTVPTSAGVEYLVGEQVVVAGAYTVTAPANVTVTAQVIKGYFLQKGALINWSYSFTAAANCQAVLSATTTTTTATTTPTTQVAVTPKGAVNAGGQGNIAAIGLAVSAVLLTAGALLKKITLK
ncbi:hypothetical protein EBS40_03275 [bacterium]|nr:hypothetical protein [bacterium]